MGYSTDLTGVLKFTHAPSVAELAHLKTFLGEHTNDHADWIKPDGDISYIQWDITDDFSGIQWDGNEKFYDIVESVNFLIANMQAKFPEWGLEGSVEAQGEEFDDRWTLLVKNNVASRVDVPKPTDVVKCPHCDERFSLSDAA